MIFAARARRLGVLAALALIGAVLFFARRYQGQDAPFTPNRDDEILERIPAGLGADPVADETRRLEAQLARQPDDLSLAGQVARRHIEAAGRTGDAQLLSYAEAALAPWWSAKDPPPSALLLRASIKRARHQFADALVDLDAARARAKGTPIDAPLWRTRATVLGVLARYEEARASCAHLEGLASRLAAATCTAQIDGVTGHAADARARLAGLIGAAGVSAAESRLALSVRGEGSLYAGDAAAAERDLRAALVADASDAHTRALLADLLLDGDRPNEVLSLIAADEPNDALLLRRAIAAARTPAPDAEALRAGLHARGEERRARGDTTLEREEARLRLELEHDAARALPIAVANFARQSGPSDARILLESAAQLARDPATRPAALEAAAPALRWLEKSGCTWPALTRAATALDGVKR